MVKAPWGQRPSQWHCRVAKYDWRHLSHKDCHRHAGHAPIAEACSAGSAGSATAIPTRVQDFPGRGAGGAPGGADAAKPLFVAALTRMRMVFTCSPHGSARTGHALAHSSRLGCQSEFGQYARSVGGAGRGSVREELASRVQGHHLFPICKGRTWPCIAALSSRAARRRRQDYDSGRPALKPFHLNFSF